MPATVICRASLTDTDTSTGATTPGTEVVVVLVVVVDEVVVVEEDVVVLVVVVDEVVVVEEDVVVVVVDVCAAAINTIDVFCHQHTPVRGQRNIPVSLSAHPKNGRLAVARTRNAFSARHVPDDDSVISRLNVLTHICGAAPRTGHTNLNCEAVSQRFVTA